MIMHQAIVFPRMRSKLEGSSGSGTGGRSGVGDCVGACDALFEGCGAIVSLCSEWL